MDVDGWMWMWMDGWMDVDGWVWMDGCGWMDGCMDGWVDGWMNRWRAYTKTWGTQGEQATIETVRGIALHYFTLPWCSWHLPSVSLSGPFGY